MYADGQGLRKDDFIAKKYYEKGCALNSGPACNNLGLLYVYGDGVAQNLSTAKEYFGKGCDFGSQKGCDNYKRDWLKKDDED
ncbi:hypothetical protein DMC01_12940 [Campylobacter troglodytis]|nr:hypothetical protein DMC01_12940 [Campylobacter troglodytis]